MYRSVAVGSTIVDRIVEDKGERRQHHQGIENTATLGFSRGSRTVVYL
ncbi:hypothetical protein [Tumidithrix helvetica]